jgi:hypothetical protein
MHLSRSFALIGRSFVFSACLNACSGDPRVIAEDTAVFITGADSSSVRVSLAGDTTRIAGRFAETQRGLMFKPAFPFDSGRDYEVISGATRTPFRFAAEARAPSTRITAIYPSSDTLPENLLRLYVEFSSPMSRGSGLPYVKLLDDQRREVKQAFLPLDASFWNGDFTRYTLFLDPGRVKRGILPNEDMGRALIAGRRYSIVIDSTWKDGRGQPLVSPFTKAFVAAKAEYRPISLDRWRLEIPVSGGRQPLTVRFDRQLDHGLLARAIGVAYETGVAIEGQLDIIDAGRAARFTPAQNWSKALYHVVVLDILEDLAGNRVNQAFEVDSFVRADSTGKVPEFKIVFRIH